MNRAQKDAHRCQQGRAPCPCPHACEMPAPCATWQPAASTAPPHRPTGATELRALLAHAAVVLLACGALVFIVKTASSP